MHIVHIIFSFNLGGAELMLIDIMNKQIESSTVSLIIVNNYNDMLIEKLDPRIQLHLIGRKERSKNLIPIIKLNYILYWMSPDVIHCHNVNLIKLFLFKKNQKKSVLTIHTTGISSPYFGMYKQLFAISKAVKDDLHRRYRLNSIVVYNGVKIERIRPKFTPQKRVCKIIQVSRLEHTKKGQDLLIKALKEVLLTYEPCDISLDFIGCGSSEYYLKSLIQELNLENKVNFLGLKDRDYVYSHLADYDLLVQPSLYEGFGLTIAEAMLAKVPVLVSNIEGPMEVINNGEYGYYFESGSAESLKNILSKILIDGIDNKITEDAYKYAKANFDITGTVKNYLEEYRC